MKVPTTLFLTGTEWAIESIIASTLSKALKQSLFLGLRVQTVWDLLYSYDSSHCLQELLQGCRSFVDASLSTSSSALATMAISSSVSIRNLKCYGLSRRNSTSSELGYNRIEITLLTPDISRSASASYCAIVSHLTPILHEKRFVCKEVVKDAEYLPVSVVMTVSLDLHEHNYILPFLPFFCVC